MVANSTHDWNKFLKPEELEKKLIDLDFKIQDIRGLSYNIVTSKWHRSNDLSVNYIIVGKKI